MEDPDEGVSNGATNLVDEVGDDAEETAEIHKIVNVDILEDILEQQATLSEYGAGSNLELSF